MDGEGKVKWWHTYLDFGISGLVEPDHENFVSQIIPSDLTGKTVLDLGGWDGYYSYLAKKRNAKLVVVVDNGEGERITWGQSVIDTFMKVDYINKVSNQRIYFIPLDVFDIDKLRMNFDIIFCFGLFYHVKSPYELFEKCYQKCNEMLLLEGHISDSPDPFALFLNERELNNDPTNYWVMSANCIIKMLKRIGFKEVNLINQKGRRGLFIAKK